MLSSAVSKSLDQQGECRGRLTPARVVEVIAGKGRAPIRQHPNEPALRNAWLHMSLGKIGKAQALERSVQEKARAVEDKLPLDSNVDLAPVLLQLPSVQATTMGRQAKVEAIVLSQILGCFWPLAFGEVGRRAYDRHPEVGTDAHRYHVLGDKLARPDTSIHLLRHDVGEAVVDDDLYMDIGDFGRTLPRAGNRISVAAYSVAVSRTVPAGFSRSSLSAARSASISLNLGPILRNSRSPA